MKNKHIIKPLLLLFGLTFVFILWRFTPLGQYFKLENATLLANFAKGLGWAGPIIYLAFYTFGAPLLIPGSVLSVVGALGFGIFPGVIYVSIGTTTGAAGSFLVARYLARPTVEKIISKRPMFQKLDKGVTEHGWRMVAIVRLMPIFPYMFMNYALGLTNIRFTTYVIVSFVAMLPANFGLCLMAGSLVSGKGDIVVIFLSLLGAGLIFSGLALLPVFLKKRLPQDIASELDSVGGNNFKWSFRRKILIAIIAFILFTVASYFGYASYKQSQTTVTSLVKQLQFLDQVERSLLAKTSNLDELQEQFERIRKTAKELLGNDGLALVESPICETWPSIAKSFSFQTVACETVQIRWTKLVLTGNPSSKEKLYQKLEKDLHPVSIRAVLISNEEKNLIKLTIVLLDKYNTAARPSSKDRLNFNTDVQTDLGVNLFYKNKIKSLSEKISDTNQRLENLRSKVISVQDYKRKSSLLLLVINRFNNPALYHFSLMEKERVFAAGAENKFPDILPDTQEP